jgi:FXSXX-COOH protein
MSERARLYPDGEAHLFIADVGDTPLDVLLSSDDSVLDHLVKRLLSESGKQGENYSAHSSSA